MTAPGGVAPDRLPLPLPRAARARPHHPAVVAGDGVALTYAELAERADDVACRLAAAGVTAGDRVAVLVGDGARFAVLLHATARLGAVLVPLSTRLTAGELGWQVGDARPRLVVADPPRSAAAPGTLVLSWQALSDLAAADAPLVDDVRLDAPATMIYTSGTTGRPKGAVLTFGNLAWSAAASALRLGLLPGDRWLVPLPLFHVGGLAVLWRAALAATTVIAPGHFDAAGVAAAIAGGGATLVSLVPTMLARVLGAWGDRPPPAGLRAVLLGGGPAAPALVDRAIRLGFPIALTYGLTEAASQVATDWPRRDPADVDGGAPPLAFTEVRVVGADGAPLLVGEDGAIEVRGPTVMAGYWGDPDATARALAGGWLATGDIGRLDAAGRLHVRGRREDLIVTGGRTCTRRRSRPCWRATRPSAPAASSGSRTRSGARPWRRRSSARRGRRPVRTGRPSPRVARRGRRTHPRAGRPWRMSRRDRPRAGMPSPWARRATGRRAARAATSRPS